MSNNSFIRSIVPIVIASIIIFACPLSTSLPTPAPVSGPTSTFTGLPVVLNATDTTTPVAPSDTFTPTSAIPTATDTPTPVPPTATSSQAMVTPLSVAVNCRYAPETTYQVLGDLMPGVTVPILGTNPARNWWQIANPDNPSQNCWVGNPVVITSGDIASVPVVSIPTAYVTKVKINLDATTIHGTCGGPNANDWTGNISTNGPITVTFHWEIWNTGGSMRNSTADQHMVFATWGTQSDNPGSYSTDCGNYTVKLVITSPNSISDSAQYKVVHP